jgi:DNA-binding transcriptional MerR regulator
MTPQTCSLTIGALAKACDVSTPTIRYYEKIDLMPKADRTRSDQRRYGAGDVQRLTFIRRCRAFGFSTQQVRSLVAVPDGSTTNCNTSQAIAQDHIENIRAKITDLRALEDELMGVISACQSTCGDQENIVCGAFSEMQTSRP